MGKDVAAERERVTGVTLHITSPSGQSRTITLDPRRVEGLFWSDRAVNEILAPFYDTIEKKTTKTELVDRFGKSITSVFSELGTKGEQVTITPALIRALWLNPNDHGNLRPFMAKTIKCIPNGG